MRKVDYAYIVLLTVITTLLLLLVLKPDPKPPQSKQYSEVVCEAMLIDLKHGKGFVSMMWNKKKTKKGERALKAVADPIEAKIKDGWMVLPMNFDPSIVCFAR